MIILIVFFLLRMILFKNSGYNRISLKQTRLERRESPSSNLQIYHKKINIRSKLCSIIALLLCLKYSMCEKPLSNRIQRDAKQTAFKSQPLRLYQLHSQRTEEISFQVFILYGLSLLNN